MLSIEVNEIDIMNRVLENTVKMISRRVYFTKDGKFPLINYDKAKKVIEKETDDDVYEFKCDNGKKVILKVMLQKITSINKNVVLSDFLLKYKNEHKIFIFKEIGKKTISQLHAYGTVECFLEKELMADVLDFEYQPKFEVLSSQEKEECMKSYNITEKQFPKMKHHDPVARYLHVSIGTVLRVLQPSELSGQTVSYCIVIK